MFKTLLAVTLRGMFSGQMRGTRRNRFDMPKPLRFILPVVLVAYIGYLLTTGVFQSLAVQLNEAALPQLYFGMTVLASVLMAVFASLMTAQSMLFEAKDNAMLLAMPIPARTILAARLVSQYILSLILTAVLLVPATVAWQLVAPLPPAGLAAAVAGLFLLPCLSLAITVLVGWLIAFISSRLRRKNIVKLILSLVFFVGYLVFVAVLNQLIEKIVRAGQAFYTTLKSVFYPSYAFAEAVLSPGFGTILRLVAVTVLPLLAVVSLVSMFFISIVTRVPGEKKVVYRAKTSTSRSTLGALWRREWRRYMSNALVLLNTAVGAIMLLLLSGYLLIAGGSVRALIDPLQLPAGSILYLLVPLQALLAATSTISASSISIEGQTFWLLLALPASPAKILRSKLLFHLSVIWPPMLLSTAAALIVFGGTLSAIVSAVVLPFLFLLLTAQLGLILNLRFYRFDYVNEVYAVKQSMSVIITMLSVMALAGLSVAFVSWLGVSLPLAALLFGGVLVVLNVLLAVVLSTWGERRFAEAGEA